MPRRLRVSNPSSPIPEFMPPPMSDYPRQNPGLNAVKLKDCLLDVWRFGHHLGPQKRTQINCNWLIMSYMRGALCPDCGSLAAYPGYE